MADGELILATGALLAGALLAPPVAGRLRAPGLPLGRGAGTLIGPDGAGWLGRADSEVARATGILGHPQILFGGGLRAGPPEIEPGRGAATSLATLGPSGTA